MTPEQQERVKELFEAASDLDPSQQETFLDEACEDEEVLAEVKSLLSQHIPKGFMGGPVLSGKSSSSGKKSGPSALSEAALKKIGVRYEGIVEVGGGGMGTVYRARDRETKEVVALKILRPEIAGDEQQVERFKNEVLLAHQITHKNVCRIYDFSRADGTAYISMEFVEGDTLRHIVDRFGSLSVRSTIQITQQI